MLVITHSNVERKSKKCVCPPPLPEVPAVVCLSDGCLSHLLSLLYIATIYCCMIDDTLGVSQRKWDFCGKYSTGRREPESQFQKRRLH